MKELTVSYTIWDIKSYVLYPFHNSLFVMLCTIWYHLCNLKKRKKHSWRSDTSACNFLKVSLLHECFSRFLNCVNGTKSRKASHILFSRKLKDEFEFMTISSLLEAYK